MPNAPADPAGNPGNRRELILQHAERLFAEDGFHGTTLAGIAKASGLKNAGVIHYFPSKAHIYRAVLENLAADLEDRLAEAIDGVDDCLARLRALLDVQINWIHERPVAVRLVQRELLDNADRVRSAHVLPLSKFVTMTESIVVEAQTAGVVPPGPTETKINLLLGPFAYGAIVRPTFRQMLGGALLSDETVWMQAIAEDVLAGLTGRVDPDPKD